MGKTRKARVARYCLCMNSEAIWSPDGSCRHCNDNGGIDCSEVDQNCSLGFISCPLKHDEAVKIEEVVQKANYQGAENAKLEVKNSMTALKAAKQQGAKELPKGSVVGSPARSFNLRWFQLVVT
eukprot:symbB.v1.2.010045.t1/scaffold650.1/size176305/24